MDKVIAIDIDDTLNNFTETLEKLKVKYKDYKWLYDDEEQFNKDIAKIKNNGFNKEDFKDSKYSNLYYSLHQEVYIKAKARQDAIKFMKWLKRNNWKILILTYRDLRYVLKDTKDWFNKYKIPYDYFFHTNNKVIFCGIWKIKYLIDDNPYNIVGAPGNGINMFYPIIKNNEELVSKPTGSTPFNSFDELYEVIKND